MTYALCIPKKAFSSSKREKLEPFVKLLKSRLEKEDLLIEVIEELSPKWSSIEKILIVKAPREKVEYEAEKEGVLKQNMTTKQLDVFVRDKKKAKGYYQNYENEEFWLPSEELSLLHDILDSIIVGEEYYEDIHGFISTPHESSALDAHSHLLHALIQAQLLVEPIPLKNQSIQKSFFQSTKFQSPLNEPNILGPLYSYYGSNITLFFAWMRHYTIWLCAPGILGGILYLHNKWDPEVSIDNSMLAPYYTIFIIIWGMLFVQYWKRYCAKVSCELGTKKINAGISMGIIYQKVRPEFHGVEMRTSPITGRQEPYYPLKLRYIQYLKSIIVTGGMLGIACCIMILSLNLQGYIHSDSFFQEYLHFPTIQQFSNPGCIFDPKGEGPWPSVLPLIPVVIHALVIQNLNAKYRQKAIELTEAENHVTQEDFDFSYVMKRFCFEAFDSYMALFFLAFVQADIVLLRKELSALYTVDSIRRIVTECVIPYILKLQKTKSSAAKKKDDDSSVPNDSSIFAQVEEDEYEQFDDYLEMVIQFGYVTLFASAFPLAALLSVACNLIEMKSDMFKLTYVVRRPHSIRTDNIGSWLYILQGMVFLSIITNVYIFAFTTEQMMQLFPSFFVILESDDVMYGGSDHMHVVREGQGRWVYLIAVVIEHCLFLLAFLITVLVPDVPEHVKMELKRREYRYAQMMMMKNQD